MEFLVQFVPDLGSSAFDELDTLLIDAGFDPDVVYPRPGRGGNGYPSNCTLDRDISVDPFVVLTLPSVKAAYRILRKSVLIKYAWILVASGKTLAGCMEHLRSFSCQCGEKSPDLGVEGLDASDDNNIYSFLDKPLSPRDLMNVLGNEKLDWRIFVDTFHSRIVKRKSLEIRMYLHNPCLLQPRGKVRLTEGFPITYSVILDFGPSANAPLGYTAPSVPSPQTCRCTSVSAEVPSALNANIPEAQEKALRRAFFGVRLPETNRRFVGSLCLKSRPYLGPTSLDAQLALLMCNLAGAGSTPGTVIYDPFVGTGSVSVAAAALGAWPFGSDIDMRVLNGKLGINASHNFAKYGLPFPELLAIDNGRLPFRKPTQAAGGFLDAIVTDPPYGVRAGARKNARAGAKLSELVAEQASLIGDVEKALSALQLQEQEDEKKHAGSGAAADIADSTTAFPNADTPTSMPPALAQVDADEVVLDLLDQASRNLVMGGRIVYLFPSVRGAVDTSPSAMDGPTNGGLPHHPCLRVKYVSVEPLSPIMCRYIVTMEKIAPYKESLAKKYRLEGLLAGIRGNLFGPTGGIRSRMAATLDNWYEDNKDKAELWEQQLSTCRERRNKAGDEALATDGDGGGGGGATNPANDVETSALTTEETLSRKQIKKNQKRLYRQERRHARLEGREFTPKERDLPEGVVPPPPKTKLTRQEKKRLREERVAAALKTLEEGGTVKVSHLPFDKLFDPAMDPRNRRMQKDEGDLKTGGDGGADLLQGADMEGAVKREGSN